MSKIIWVLLPTFIATLLANLTIFHAWTLHKSDFSRLWVLAPNQFTYPLLVFPFAAMCCFISFYGYFWRIPEVSLLVNRPLPKNASLVLIENPSLVILIALSLSIAAVFVVYEKGQWTFDKLKPIHASHALNAMDAIDKQVDALSKKDEQEALRIRSIRAAQLELAKIKANKPTTVNDINAYDDWLFLQVVRDNELPQKLGMFDRGLIVLNVVQMITILFVFALIVVLAGLCYFDGDAIADAGGEVVVWLHRSSQASLIALVLAALFAFFYLLLNKHIEPFVGKGGVTLFNYIVPILCLVFVWILVRYGLQYRTLDTTNWWEATKAAIPMLGALASVSVIAFLMEKFIGRDVSSSTRLLGNILIVALCLFSVKDTVIEFASSAK